MRGCLSLLTLLCALAPGIVRGHAVPIEGLTPFFASGQLVGAGTTWGVVLADGSGFQRVCEEAPGAPPAFYHRTDDGRVLVAGDAGLLATLDGGCTYEAVAGELGDHQIGAFAAARRAPARIAVGTQTPGRLNGIFVSVDEGRTFVSTVAAAEGVRFDAVLLSDDGQTLVAYAQDFATFEGVVYVSRDGGATFERGARALDGFAFVRLLAVAEDGVTFAAAVALEQGGNTLLLSDDAFETAEEIASFDDEVTAFADLGGQRFVSLSRSRLLRQPEPAAPFAAVDGPARCLLRVPGDPRLFGCGLQPDGAHFLATLDGARWERLLPFLGVEERLCPEDTPGLEVCSRYWGLDAGPAPDRGDLGRDAGPLLGRGVGRLGEPPACRCAGVRLGSPPAATFLALVMLLGLGFRARRTGSGHPLTARRGGGRVPLALPSARG